MSSKVIEKGKCDSPRKSVWKHFTEISTSNNNSNESSLSSNMKKRPEAKCNYCKQ